ncbi:MAG: hypothetical protein WC740_16585 [Verrucomicrobiia bacterium]
MKSTLLVIAILIMAVFVIWNRPEFFVIHKYIPFTTTGKVERELERVLPKNPYLTAVKKYDPDYYNLMRNLIVEICRGNISMQQMESRIQEADSFDTKFLARAPDDAVLAFAEVIRSVLRQLSVNDTDTCFSLAFDDCGSTIRVGQKMMSGITEGTEDALLGTMAYVVEAASTNPQLAPDPIFVQKKLDEINTELGKVYGDDVRLLDDKEAARTNKKQACAVAIEAITRTTRLPKKEASAVLRVLLAKKKW